MIPWLNLLALSLSIALLITGCAPASTPVASVPTSTPEASLPPGQIVITERLTVAEAEALAGFDVKEPASLPAGVSLDYASFMDAPSANVTLHYKLVHEQFGEMGAFFQITQEPQPEAPADTTSCPASTNGCEVLQVGGLTVIYILNAGGTEGLMWYSDGLAFRLLRTAGEPNKVYKDELVKVVESMK